MGDAATTPGADGVTAGAALRLRGIVKRFPGLLANDDVRFDVRAGEGHTLLGENGAGKSTLMKIIYGAVRPDAGHIEWNGQPVEIASPGDARAMGIAMVFQHFALFDSASVVENMALALPGWFDLKSLAARITETADPLPISLKNAWCAQRDA